MTRGRSQLVRAVAALVGLALVAGGGAVLAWTADLWAARRIADGLTVPRVSGWPSEAWWPWALAGVCALAVVTALWLLTLTLASRKVGPVRLPGSDDEGALSTDLSPLAAAAAERLEMLDGVGRVRHRVRRHRGVPTADLVVHCSPTVDLDALAESAREADRALAAALPDIAVRHRVLVHVDRVDHHADHHVDHHDAHRVDHRTGDSGPGTVTR